jgi:dTDP-4-dehydrorhamnose 3,5-epimerase
MIGSEMQASLPFGIVLTHLKKLTDDRGSLMEIFRTEWGIGVEPVQWNFVKSAARVLRGVHLHLVHSDYLVLLEGLITIGLADLRKCSPTTGTSAIVQLDEYGYNAIMVPPGVAHGFYFPQPSYHVYGVSHTWDLADELGCRWNDPGLKLDWPCTSPILSERDASLPILDQLIKELTDEL